MTGPLDEVLALEAAGLFLSAHDRAIAALSDGEDDDRLRHRAVLALARGGATRPALTLFHRFKLAGHADPDIAALEGRLLKD
ncbi:MAG: adenylate cyclase, partial [Alphaproteobacteria bacterium]|nr:adenylate cyclase [Alphaproteobacteria bacterium]